MTSHEKEFLNRAVILQQKYAQIGSEMGLQPAELTQLWDNLKVEREALTEVLALYKRKMKADNPDAIFQPDEFAKFLQWHNHTEKVCLYCGLSQEKIALLVDRELVNTKRIDTRGKSLELERRKPNLPYSNTKNLIWCCYWCNNAKTDEFSEEEFKPIGKLIGEVLIKRLSK
jgi:hypothetical protein